MVTKAKIIQSSDAKKKKQQKVKKFNKSNKSTVKKCKTSCCLQPFMKRNVLILTTLLVVVALLFIFTHTPASENNQENMSVVATINGEPLYQYEIDNYWNLLSAEQKTQVEKDDLIQELISQKLLLQRAAERGFSTTREQAQTILENQIAQQGANFSEYVEWLESQDMNLEDVLQTIAQQTTLSKLLEEETNSSAVNVSQEEINTYYEENKEQFMRPEQMTVRHILIMNSEDSNESEVVELVQHIESELDAQNNENFCELVNEYSADTASKENCGEYTFKKDEMVPEFENAAWDMAIGERRTVQSNYGYHIMLKMDKVSKGRYTLSDFVPGTEEITFEKAIGNMVLEEKAKAIFDEYVQELKKGAKIVFKD
ncbi:MAG: peptidylprolyl isomerase [Candidatus Nanoarchaeia archaeon]